MSSMNIPAHRDAPTTSQMEQPGPARPTEGSNAADLQVYYDGGCPICSREIAFYRARPGAERFAWVDVSRADAELGPGLTPTAGMARMHVRTSGGTLLTGADAFAAMWRMMPGFRWLGRLLAIPPFGTLAEWAYRGFLLGRKLWR